jgi:inner membrane protein
VDNISHSVVSLVSGELLHRSLPPEASAEAQSLRQKLLLFTAAAAGNFPDLDLVLYPLLKKPLGYLLHHRGHSHTIAGAIFEALLLLALTLALWPSARRLLKTSVIARRGYALAAAIGFTLHLSMDWLNSYGVHPFYPLSMKWVYGDLVFIVEPVFWIAFGVPLAFLTRRWWIRAPWLALIVGVPAYATWLGYVPAWSFGVLVAIGAALGLWQAREVQSGRRALTGAWVIGILFVVIQAFASAKARSLLKAELQTIDPSARLLDEALSPSPSNPFCWSFVTIEETSARYRLRNGLISIAPWKTAAAFRPENCPRLFGSQGDNTLLGSGIVQTSEVSADVTMLREQDSRDCHLHAWMRFARMPYVTETSASDLRFSRGGAHRNFTTLTFADFQDEPCSSWIPQWEPPRRDLLNK